MCGGMAYAHDNNSGYQFRVALNAAKFPQANNQLIGFRYGNDIDNSQVARNGVEVMATAQGGPESCTEARPAIVRYLK